MVNNELILMEDLLEDYEPFGDDNLYFDLDYSEPIDEVLKEFNFLGIDIFVGNGIHIWLGNNWCLSIWVYRLFNPKLWYKPGKEVEYNCVYRFFGPFTITNYRG